MFDTKYFIESIGIIACSGNDTIDFINRMSTNDFREFSENENRYTVFTTDKGRIIDLSCIINITPKILLTTSAIYEQALKSHIEKYIITDDILPEIPAEKYARIILFGNDLKDSVRKMFEFEPEVNNVYKLNDTDLFFEDKFGFKKVNIICKRENLSAYSERLKECDRLDEKEYEIIRINHGIPRAPNELNEGINPAECGLKDLISYTKGCYIGQEVIARLDSQGKIPKQMVRLHSANIFGEKMKIYTEDNQETGFVTSAVENGGGYSGLGFIRSVNLDFESSYFIRTDEGKNKINISKII